MEKQLIDFTEENARHIAELLKEEYDRHHVWEDKVMVGLKEKNSQEQSVYIHPTGQVSFLFNDGEPGGSGFKDINSLPITDYLREQGFEFKY